MKVLRWFKSRLNLCGYNKTSHKVPSGVPYAPLSTSNVFSYACWGQTSAILVVFRLLIVDVVTETDTHRHKNHTINKEIKTRLNTN